VEITVLLPDCCGLAGEIENDLGSAFRTTVVPRAAHACESLRRPRYPNWLKTTGGDRGGNLFRWVEADEHPPVTTRIVKFAEL
jgi:hypothetical protein